MTILTNTAEGGTNNTTATPANTGGASGTAFTAMSPYLQFKSDITAFGSLAYGWSSAGAVDGVVRWALGDTSKMMSGRFYFYLSTTTTPGTPLVSITGAADATNCLRLLFISTGAFRMSKDGTTHYYTSSAGVLQASTWCYVDWWVNTGTSAADGTAQAVVRRKADDALIADSGVVTNNFGAGVNLTNARVFKFGAENYAGDMRFDQLEVRTGADSSGLIGPYAAVNLPPTGTISANQNVSAGATFNASVTASDPDGSIASYAWSVLGAKSTSTPTLTGASTANVSGTAGAAGSLHTLQCIVTDNGGATTTLTTEVRVPLAGNAAVVPLALDGASSGMTRVGGTTAGGVLADSSDSTYMETGALTDVEQWHEFRWQPHGNRTTGQLTPIRLGTDTGTANAVIYLKEGSTVRQSWSQPITSTATDYTYTMSGATIAAISDFSNLFCRVGFTS